MISCRVRLVTMDETWLYHYDPETKQQSMEWWHSSLPRPTDSECKNPLEKFSPRFFGIKMASSSLIIVQRAKLATRSITHLCWCKWRTFWRKTPRKVTKEGLVLARQCPGSPGTCNSEETGLPGLPMSWSPTLFSGSGPVTLPPVPWTEKKQLKGRQFSSDMEVIAATRPGWTDNLLNFFLSGLQKLEQWAKKCIELRREYVE